MTDSTLKKSQPGAKQRVAVVGARGYAGLELARLLLRHPEVELAACFATGPFSLSDYLGEAKARLVPGLETKDLLPLASRGDLDFVFLATPAQASIELAPKLLELGVKVIDLSGAFRLSGGQSEQEIVDTYQHWYGFSHQAPRLVKSAEYGLVPWASKVVQESAQLIANPGCFATAILMGLLPLLKDHLIEPSSLVIDAKSGSTGAGRKAEERLLHAEVDGGCAPYRIGRHQHLPEICEFAMVHSGQVILPHLTTHLLGIRRGILAGIYAKTSGDMRSLTYAFERAYSHDPLVEVIALNDTNETSALNLRRVVGTARTRIAFKESAGRLYVFSMIDNLLKGAASQAIENFNRLINLPTWTTLNDMEGVL